MAERSRDAAQYRKLYKSPLWQAARQRQLIAQPLCERHLKRGAVVAAAVVHHRQPHRGDWTLFTTSSNLESLCKPCHDSEAQSEERLGYSKAIGQDGFPIDPNHPANRKDKP